MACDIYTMLLSKALSYKTKDVVVTKNRILFFFFHFLFSYDQHMSCTYNDVVNTYMAYVGHTRKKNIIFYKINELNSDT